MLCVHKKKIIPEEITSNLLWGNNTEIKSLGVYENNKGGKTYSNSKFHGLKKPCPKS